MNRALLLIDRGSREPEAKEELVQLCNMIKEQSRYVLVDHCFLEVIPPYIEEGISRCVSKNVDSITVMPVLPIPWAEIERFCKKDSQNMLR